VLESRLAFRLIFVVKTEPPSTTLLPVLEALLAKSLILGVGITEPTSTSLLPVLEAWLA
jgi:hypothetical protein